MSLEETKQLVIENAALQNHVHRLVTMLAALTLEHGKEKSSKRVELRIAKAQLNKVNHRVNLEQTKSGGEIIVLTKGEDLE